MKQLVPNLNSWPVNRFPLEIEIRIEQLFQIPIPVL